MVNKFHFILLALFLVSTNAKSQVSVYAAAGTNISNVDYNDIINPETIFSSQAYSQLFLSIGIAIPITEKFHILNEISYSPNGYKGVFLNKNVYQTRKYKHINLQSGLSYQINPIRIELGGFIGVKLSDKIENIDGRISSDLKISKSPNFGAFAGLNISVYKNLGVFGRYYLGLSELANYRLYGPDDSVVGHVVEKVSNIQIGVSVLLF